MSLRKILIIHWRWVSPTPFQQTHAKLPIVVQLSGLVYSTTGIRIYQNPLNPRTFATIWYHLGVWIFHDFPLFTTQLWGTGYLHLWKTPFLKTYVSKSNDGCHSLATVSLPRGCCSTAWGPNTGWVTIATYMYIYIYIMILSVYVRK